MTWDISQISHYDSGVNLTGNLTKTTQDVSVQVLGVSLSPVSAFFLAVNYTAEISGFEVSTELISGYFDEQFKAVLSTTLVLNSRLTPT